MNIGSQYTKTTFGSPLQRWRHYVRRAAQMTGDEMLDRGRQAAAKRIDLARYLVGHDFSSDRIREGAHSGRFFFNPELVDALFGVMKVEISGRGEEIVREANQVLQHKFDLLGFEKLDYNDSSGQVDWHWDAVHNKRAPRRVFYRIQFLNFDECGDSKVIWELNRHQHFVTLAKAFRLTRDRRYLNEILQQKAQWDRENPYPIGINWASSLEVAFRSLSWLWTCYLVGAANGPNDLRAQWLGEFELHGRHIERYLSRFFSPNTHLLGEGVALFFLGTLCPELARAERWRELGWRITLLEAERQVRDDGFHFEQSTHYHVYALDFFLHTAILARINGVCVPPSLDTTIQKMLGALVLLGRFGAPTQLGDDDGGRLFDARRNRSEHMVDPLSTGAVLYERSDFKSVSPSLREETIWLLGEEGVRKWKQLSMVSASNRSSALPNSGLYFLRSEKAQLIVDAGPLGVHGGGHGHADALSVTLQCNGESILIDAGTLEYAGKYRHLYRSTAMHNTLQVNGMSQSKPTDLFSWGRLANCNVETWTRTRGLDLLVASHDGYCSLKNPVVHRRWVVSLKSGAYIVRDMVEGAGVHTVEIYWHLAPHIEHLAGDVFQSKISGAAFVLRAAQSNKFARSFERKDCSPVYGTRARTTEVKFIATVELPIELAVLLIASEGSPPDSGCFRKLACQSADRTSIYEYQTVDEVYSFAFNDEKKPFCNANFSSDARFVVHGKRGASERIILCDGSYAFADSRLGLAHAQNVRWGEVVRDNGQLQLMSSDPTAFLENANSFAILDVVPTVSGEI